MLRLIEIAQFPGKHRLVGPVRHHCRSKPLIILIRTLHRMPLMVEMFDSTVNLDVHRARFSGNRTMPEWVLVVNAKTVISAFIQRIW